ncbi:MAG: S8 family serine peptidase [Bacteroidales bacterium]|nr:S8 family serine peptidase [Bacteroidales bacterium]
MLRVKMKSGSYDVLTKGGEEHGAGLGMAMTRSGASMMRRSIPDNGRFSRRRSEAGLDLWYDIYIPESCPVEEAIELFRASESVEIAEPVYRMEQVGMDACPVRQLSLSGVDIPYNDPYAGKQWHLFPTFPVTSCYAGDAHLNILPAWQATPGDREVIVAVMDGGIDFSHPDLADAMWDDGNGNCGYNFLRNSNEIIPSDHGTGVAAVIGAVNNNGEGICGIAGGDSGHGGVRLMSCQVFDDDGIASPDIGKFMAYAADNGAVISQNSWNYVGLKDLSQYGKDAIDYFIRNAGMDENGNQVGPMAGGIVVFAAGNAGIDTPQYPAAYPPVISVASLSADFVKADSSNYGDWVDISAFGGAPGIYSAGAGGGYGFVQGTSIAAPQIAGLAALVVSHKGGPGFTNTQLEEIILGSGRAERVNVCNPEYAGKLGAGVPDAGCMMYYGVEPGNVTDLSATGRRSHIELCWTAPECYDNRPVTDYDVFFSAELSLDGLDCDHPGDGVQVRHFCLSPQNAGDPVNCIIDRLDRLHRYSIAVVARSPYGTASVPAVINASTSGNSAPAAISPIDDIVLPGLGKEYGTEIDLYSHFMDIDMPGDNLMFFVSMSREGIVSCREEKGIIYLMPMASGNTVLTAVAADEDGEMAEISFRVTCIGELGAYPNPFVDVLNIVLPGMSGEVPVVIYDRAGHAALRTSVELDADGKGSISAGGLSPGKYNMVIEMSGKTFKKGVVKC